MKLAPALTLALVALLSAGCPDASTGPGPAVAPTNSASAARAQPGLITSSPALAEMVCALGAREHLLGVSRYCVYPPELDALPRIGGIVDPNLEAIDALAPDHVLLQGKHEGLSALAQRRPWTLEHFKVDTVAEVRGALTRLGELLGRAGAAQAEVARLDAALAEARAGAPAKAPRVLLVFGRKPGPLTQVPCVGRETFLSELLEACGGENALEQTGYPLASAEVLLARAPELVIELSIEPLDAEARALLRADWQSLPELPAVEQEAIAIASGDHLLFPGPRLDQTLDKLGRVLAGERDVQ